MCGGVLHQSYRAGPEECCVLLQQVAKARVCFQLRGLSCCPSVCLNNAYHVISPHPHPCRAAAHSKLGNYTEATCDCERAIGIDPTYSKAYGRMG